jgi:hypothetical protein
MALHSISWPANPPRRLGVGGRLDDHAAAHRPAARVGSELVAARQFLTELGRWQDVA